MVCWFVSVCVYNPVFVFILDIQLDNVVVGVFVLLFNVVLVTDTELVLVLLFNIDLVTVTELVLVLLLDTLPDILLVTDLVLVLVILLEGLGDTELVFVVVSVAVDVNDTDAVVLAEPDEEPDTEWVSEFVLDATSVIVSWLVIEDDPVTDGDGDELNVLNEIVDNGVFVFSLYVADTVGVNVFVIVCTI